MSFYSILVASSVDIIQDDGTTATSIHPPATIHPLFTPVLLAHKNSKAPTTFMQDAVESTRSTLGNSNDNFASNANLLESKNVPHIPSLLPFVLAIAGSTSACIPFYTLLKGSRPTSVVYHYLAPPRTGSAIYKSQ